MKMTTPDETLMKLTNGFVAYMTRNRHSPDQCEKYGISVTDFSPDSKRVFLTFTFRNGFRYCCPYSCCHHGLLFDEDYERLRECFHQAAVEVGRPMQIHMRVICEIGALFDDGPRVIKMPPAYEQVERHDNDEVYDKRKAEKVKRR
jgi:hypothetical protein